MEWGLISVDQWADIVLPLTGTGIVIYWILLAPAIKKGVISFRSDYSKTLKFVTISGLLLTIIFVCIPFWLTRMPLWGKILATVVGLPIGALSPLATHRMAMTAWQAFEIVRKTSDGKGKTKGKDDNSDGGGQEEGWP